MQEKRDRSSNEQIGIACMVGGGKQTYTYKINDKGSIEEKAVLLPIQEKSIIEGTRNHRSCFMLLLLS